MPRRDGTGPMDQGRLTGRGLGNCNVSEESNDVSTEKYGNRLGQGIGRRLNSENQYGCGRRKKRNGRCCGRGQNN